MRRADLQLSDLQRLLADAFAPTELDQLVLGLPGAEAWRASLPIDSGSRAEHAARIVAFLLDRGRIDEALMQAIRLARPDRARKLNALNLRRTKPPTDLHPLLTALRAHAASQARVLPGVFKVGGGPAALSEIAVELVLRDGGTHTHSDAPFRGARRRGAELLTGLWSAFGGRVFPVRELLDLPHRRWILLGEPGSGKTTSLRHFALHVIEKTTRVPVLLKVSDLGTGGLMDVLERRLKGASCTFLEAARKGGAVVLVDGLDEALDPVAAREALETLSITLPEKSLLVVTSRTVGYEQPGTDFGELMLCPLRRAQQRDLLSRWLPERPVARIDEHLDSLAQSPRMARLAENPLILTLIARLLRANQRLPARRSVLYADVVKLLLTRGFDPQIKTRPFANAEAPRLVLGWLALHCHGSDTDALPAAELRRRMAEAPTEVRAALGGEDLDRFLAHVALRAGLLEGDHADLGCTERWSFAHRTFREYLAARALADDVVRNRGVKGCGLNSELDRRLTEATGNPALWAEVFALLTGLLTGSEPEALVKRLVDGGQDYKPLLFRVLADAEGLKEETVRGVLGLAAGRDDWVKRSDVLRGLPALVGNLGVAVKLLERFGKAATHGADLWWAHHLLVEIAAGRLGAGDEEARAEASGLADRLFREHRQDDRRKAQEQIKANGWWKTIPAGRFRMGSRPETDADCYHDEGPQREVEIVRGFELLAVPVTNKLYELFDPGHAQDKHDFRGTLPLAAQEQVPVYNLSWYEASAFATWLGCRLPSETEWEYACRGGTTTRFWSGPKDQDLFDVGWVDENSGGHPHSVATPPKRRGEQHPWGLHDLHGNVWEWCVDPWDRIYQGHESGISFNSNSLILNHDPARPRVVRGGGWVGGPQVARAAYRSSGRPTTRDSRLGFRLVRLLPDPS